jgi:hypothetical protein
LLSIHHVLKKIGKVARHQWLTPVIVAAQEAESRRIAVQTQPRQMVAGPYLVKTYHKKGLVERLKI